MPKNFKQVPHEVRQRLQTFVLDDVVVACAKRLRPQDVELRRDHRSLGLLYRRQGNTGFAERFLKRARELQRSSPGRRNPA